jgi:hypothetical protein
MKFSLPSFKEPKREITTGRPATWLADIDTHRAATAERVARARAYFEEVSLADFENIGDSSRPLSSSARPASSTESSAMTRFCPTIRDAT